MIDEIGKKGRRGRKPNDIPRKGHTIYCNRNELIMIKALLKELRKVDIARKEISKAKGMEIKHLAAVRHLMKVQEEVKSVSIQEMLLKANVDL